MLPGEVVVSGPLVQRCQRLVNGSLAGRDRQHFLECGNRLGCLPGLRVAVPQQQRLNALDFWCGKADGIFGWKTKAAVKRFQRTVLMPVNGRVGATTWHRMWNPEVPDGL